MKKKEILGGGGGSLSRSSQGQSTVGPRAHVLHPMGSTSPSAPLQRQTKVAPGPTRGHPEGSGRCPASQKLIAEDQQISELCDWPSARCPTNLCGPATGYMMLQVTQLADLQRGECSASASRHCPYVHMMSTSILKIQLKKKAIQFIFFV
uniref:Uncharacterized protein n=1 Tax=Bos indicus x Bos taurus TaxID=30522 RepID=A0A4W2D0K6_BOBOX